MTVRSVRRGLPALALTLAATSAAAGDGPVFRGAGHGTATGSACADGNCEKHFTRHGSDCPTCLNGRFGIGFRHRPTVPTLAPGACFGYFPTQWNRWEDVCPLPYAGAPEPPPGPKAPKTAALPDPRPAGDGTDPKGKGSDQPINPKGNGTGTKGAELPKTDLPKTDLPKTDVPKVDIPKTLPKVDPPKAPPGGDGPRGASRGATLPTIPTALPPLPAGKF
ncbi:MAG: hypothetical protein K2X82_00375 [Gemmataceae bacterium]|nr:hypothetical protein [Gemmataceae bacterium]